MKINKLNTTAYSSSILIIFWTVLLITLPINANASVSPTRIKIEAKPRDKVKFNIVVKNQNDTLRDYKVSYSYYDAR